MERLNQSETEIQQCGHQTLKLCGIWSYDGIIWAPMAVCCPASLVLLSVLHLTTLSARFHLVPTASLSRYLHWEFPQTWDLHCNLKVMSVASCDCLSGLPCLRIQPCSSVWFQQLSGTLVQICTIYNACILHACKTSSVWMLLPNPTASLRQILVPFYHS